jgi:hypothetical protein
LSISIRNARVAQRLLTCIANIESDISEAEDVSEEEELERDLPLLLFRYYQILTEPEYIAL